MRYPAKKEHPLVFRLEEARWYHQQGYVRKAQGMLDRICRDLEKKEKDIDQEDHDPNSEVVQYGSRSSPQTWDNWAFDPGYRYNPADWH